MLERELILTADGSNSLRLAGTDLTYHSVHGAIQESNAIFINAGLRPILDHFSGPLRIFEMGFGTGLNGLLTYFAAGNREIYYQAIDSFPLDPEWAGRLNYARQLNRPDAEKVFWDLHASPWGEWKEIGSGFHLLKSRADLLQFESDTKFHLVYFDAFDPDGQPELWARPVFEKIFSWLLPGAVLMTYCSRSTVRRALAAAGFAVKKMPGPPGKREITCASKI